MASGKDKRKGKVISDATKLQIYWMFWYSGLDVGHHDLCKMFDVAQSTVSRITNNMNHYEEILDYGRFTNRPDLKNQQ